MTNYNPQKAQLSLSHGLPGLPFAPGKRKARLPWLLKDEHVSSGSNPEPKFPTSSHRSVWKGWPCRMLRLTTSAHWRGRGRHVENLETPACSPKRQPFCGDHLIAKLLGVEGPKEAYDLGHPISKKQLELAKEPQITFKIDRKARVEPDLCTKGNQKEPSTRRL